MFNNSLYRYIKKHSVTNFIFKDDAKGRKYALKKLQLPAQRSYLIDDLSLMIKENHLTVYETYSDRRGHVSSFHYTAVLLDQETKDHYKLHVYFDSNNYLIQVVATDLRDNAKLELSEEAEQEISELAIGMCSREMGALRNNCQLEVKRLDNQYKRHITQMETWSADLKTNKKQYIQLAKRVIQLLEQLQYLSEGSRVYSGARTCITDFIKHLETNANNQVPDIQLNLDGDQFKEKAPKVQNPKSSRAKNTGARRRHKKGHKSRKNKVSQGNSCRKDLLEVNAMLAKLQEVDDIEAAELLLACEDKLSMWMFFSEDGSLSMQSSMKLVHLQNKCSQIINEKIAQAIKDKSFTMLEKFSIRFDDNFCYQHIVESIRGNDMEMLELVLKRNKISLDAIVIKSHKEDIPIVKYCFLQNKVDSFMMLAKYGARLMHPMSDGLPLAFHVLNSPKFVKDFYKVEGEMKNISVFYRMLIKNLRQFLDVHQEIDGKLKESIHGVINYCMSTIDSRTLMQGAEKMSGSQYLSFSKKSEQLTDSLDPEKLIDMRADEEIAEVRRQVNQKAKTLQSMMSRLDVRKLQKDSLDSLQNDDVALSGLAKLVGSDFLNKKLILNYLRGLSSILDTKIALQDVQNQLKERNRNVFFSKSRVDQYNQLALQEKMLLQELSNKQEALENRSAKSFAGGVVKNMFEKILEEGGSHLGGAALPEGFLDNLLESFENSDDSDSGFSMPLKFQ